MNNSHNGFRAGKHAFHPRECTSVVSRRMRHHVPPRRFVREREDGIAGAARLECACLLQVLTFEEQVGADETILYGARNYRRAMDMRFNPGVRGPDRCQVGTS
jgi:hypothetical protein